jgi:hypothetical protein
MNIDKLKFKMFCHSLLANLYEFKVVGNMNVFRPRHLNTVNSSYQNTMCYLDIFHRSPEIISLILQCPWYEDYKNLISNNWTFAEKGFIFSLFSFWMLDKYNETFPNDPIIVDGFFDDLRRNVATQQEIVEVV